MAQDALAFVVRGGFHAVATADLRQHGAGVGALGGRLLHHRLVQRFVEGLALCRDGLDAQPRERLFELVLHHPDPASQRLEGRAGLLALSVIVGGGEGALQVVEHLQHGAQRRGAGLRGAAALLFGRPAAHVLQLGRGAQELVVGLLLFFAHCLQLLAEGLRLGQGLLLLPVFALPALLGRFFAGSVNGGGGLGRFLVGRRFRVGVLRVAVCGGVRQGPKEVGEE
jgi:hypothetical protein